MKLGIIIPYYKNSEVCEKNFKLLMDVLTRQLTDKIMLYVYEDGQFSNWLNKYNSYNICITGEDVNRGVSYARNTGLDFFLNVIKDIDYILFIDSDDMIDSNYLIKMYRSLYKKDDILESRFFIKDRLYKYGNNDIRNGVCGQCIKTSLIGKLRFNEDICIGEDTLFMQELWKRYKIKKRLVETNYYYNLGDNMNSLSMKYTRKEIDKDKIMEVNNERRNKRNIERY